MNVTLTAKDYFNNTVTGFNSTVSLTATTLAAGGENGSFLNGPESDTYSYAETGGYAFTPNTNLVVTHVRHYDGSKISIWTDDGMLLASVPVTSVPGTWKETELPDPLPLAAGTTYRVGVYRNVPPLPYYPYLPYRFARPALFSHGVIGTAYHTYEDNFPTSSSSGIWLVDLRYLVGDPKTVSVTPTISGNFVNGVWPGAISVLENAANVRLLADDGQGRNGRSDPFDVLVLDDVWLNVSATPDPVGVGAPLAYLVTVTNSGPSAASGLVLTNYLPAGVAFVSASSSQGNTTFLAGNVIVCTLGALPAAAAATVTINVLVGEAGSITNLASVSRAEPDFTLVNNLATTVTTVRQPTLTVENASMVEGQVGTTPMVFNVRLSPASKETVTVNYVTADGSANSVDDYAGTGGTLSFAPGEMHHIVTVQVYGDGMNETNETVLLHFSQPTNAALVLTQAVGEILNDDPLPAVLIYGLSVNEGNVGSNTALFTVALTTASSRPVSVGYGVDNGTAQQPTDFVATHGVLVFPPGVTNQTIPVTINGDTSVENTETFTAYLNWTDNAFFANQQATGFIVNDDGLPGQLHHFNWAPIQTPQPAGQPFAVTITAQDYFENPASNFTGSVSLSAYQVTAEANGAILGSQVHSSSDNYGFYTLGYSFTPNADLLVTHVRHYFGSKVSVWTDDGSLLASQNVTSTPGTWEETPLSVPVWLSAGSAYRIGVYVGDGRRYWRSDGAPVFNHGAINQAWYGYQDSFPQGWDSARWWFVDLRYIVQTRQPVTLVPASTANFVAGLWTGVLAVSGSGNDVTLRADDNLGHFGLSEPFDVSGVRLDISRLGESVLLSWPTNTPGFFLESADDLSTPLTWKPVTNPPAIVGNQNVVTNTIPRSGGLFRLHNPGPP